MAMPKLELIGAMEEARWATLFGQLPNLGELCFACGVPYDPSLAHAPEYDIRVNMEAFFKACRWGFFGSRNLKPCLKWSRRLQHD
jgi:DNA polymerase III subunit epsilon